MADLRCFDEVKAVHQVAALHNADAGLVNLETVVLAAAFYFVMKMPTTPITGLPDDSPASTGSEVEPVKKNNTAVSATQPTTGAYTRLLSESDFDSSMFNAEMLDANLLTGEKAEFLSIGNSFDESALPVASEFCQKISEVAESTIAKIDSRSSIFSSRRIQLKAQTENGRFVRDEQKTSVRLLNSDSRDKYVARLTASIGQNTAHGVAVERFINLITDAINNRRMAINAAQQAFRRELDEARLAREGLTSTAVSRFRLATNSALDKAKANCTAGVAPSVVRAELQMNLKATYNKFIEDQTAAEKLSSVIQTVVTARKTAVSKALTDFKLAMESARKAFKASFPQGE